MCRTSITFLYSHSARSCLHVFYAFHSPFPNETLNNGSFFFFFALLLHSPVQIIVQICYSFLIISNKRRKCTTSRKYTVIRVTSWHLSTCDFFIILCSFCIFAELKYIWIGCANNIYIFSLSNTKTIPHDENSTHRMNGTDHLKYLRPKFHYWVEKSIARDGAQRAFCWICSYCIVARILFKPYTFSHSIFTFHRCVCVCVCPLFSELFLFGSFFSVYLFIFLVSYTNAEYIK